MNNKKLKQPAKKGVVKVPVIMQLEALECGAASLAMVMAYYNKWIPLEQVRKDCGVSRDGSNAKNILKAARYYGFEAKGYKMSVEGLREEGKFPCIIHWNFNHFVVCNGFKNDKVYLNDPALGNVVVSMKDFDEAFTGIVIIINPSEQFVPSGKPKSVYKFASNRLKGAKTAIAFFIITSVIGSLLNVINPVFSRILIDRLLVGKNLSWLPYFIAALIGFSVIMVILESIKTIYSYKINGKMAVLGNTSYMWKILRMPMEFFSQRMAGDILQRKETNASIANSLINTLAPLLMDTVMMVFYLVVVLRYNVMLSMVGIASIMINFAVSQIISKKRINISRVLMRDAGKLEGMSVAGIEMIETIKATGSENGFFEKWSGYQASVNKGNVKFCEIDNRIGLIPGMVSDLTNTIILLLGVGLVFRNQFTIGMIMAFQGFLSSFTAPALTLISANQSISEMRTQMERVEDVMEYPIDSNYEIKEEEEKEKNYSKLSGNIELRNVTFGYSPLAEPLIKDFNMTIKKGSKVAFVGASGCGKSTISKLISGLYKPFSGEILFDGKSINEIDHDVFTGSLAVVDQDIIMFEDSIDANIKMWDESIEDFEVIMAARDAKIHEDIMQRDGGYAYRISEGGKDFSGGQRQRLEIARVLAQDPTIIIMDEATSALDAQTEYEVVKSIKDRGITTIVVAHRLSTIRDCDEIVVLDKGTVVERGTHDELYAKNGYYTNLVVND